MINAEARLYNVYVQTDNYQDREYTVHDTEANVIDAVNELRHWDHVKEVSFGFEWADTTAEDLKEEVGQWIDGEY